MGQNNEICCNYRENLKRQLGFGIWDLGFGIWYWVFEIWNLRFEIWDLRIGNWDFFRGTANGRTKNNPLGKIKAVN
ncbi:hypothetical protein F3C99_05450 [Vitellibacter sp. q18]|jgi:hypothetical protein|nr:hypothetical protein [Aequorivita lutea]